MPTILANTAISNVVFYYGDGGDSPIIIGGGNLTVVDNAGEVSAIDSPAIDDVVLIKNGTDGGYDVGVYGLTGWLIKPLKGLRGEPGTAGNDGQPGAAGNDGQDGAPGGAGATGLPPAHQWNGTQIRFQRPDGTWAPYVDLRGVSGADGEDGLPGAKGERPLHQWNGTQIRFQLPDASWGAYVDLRGMPGQPGTNGTDGNDGLPGLDGQPGLPGQKGEIPAHEWQDTNLRFENPDGTFSDYVNLRGTDGNTPEIGPNGNWWIGGVDTGIPARRQNNKEIIVLDGSVDVYIIEIDNNRRALFGEALTIVAELNDGSGSGTLQVTTVPIVTTYVGLVKQYSVMVDFAMGQLVIS